MDCFFCFCSLLLVHNRLLYHNWTPGLRGALHTLRPPVQHLPILLWCRLEIQGGGVHCRCSAGSALTDTCVKDQSIATRTSSTSGQSSKLNQNVSNSLCYRGRIIDNNRLIEVRSSERTDQISQAMSDFSASLSSRPAFPQLPLQNQPPQPVFSIPSAGTC